MFERIGEFRIWNPQPDDRLVASLRTFAAMYCPSLETVYYPGCGTDSSPSVAFPESRVLYADMHVENVLSLRERGFNAMLLNAEEFVPTVSVDVLLIVNSDFDPRAAAACLRSGGYFLYHRFGTAGDADSWPNLQRVCTLGGGGSGSLLLHVFEHVDFRPIG